MRESFPFVVGCGRSGTTLIRAMLDSHPRIAVPPESYFVVGSAKKRDQYDRAFAQGDYSGFVEDLFRTEFVWWGIAEESVTQEFDAATPTSYSQGVLTLYRLFARTRDKDLFADKTPRYVLDIPLLAEMFPEACFVHVIRDGREVALSYQDQSFGPQGIANAALYWRRRIRIGQASGKTLGNERYLEIRYETLMEDPEGTLAQLCAFLRVDFAAEMLQFHDHASNMLAGTPEAANHPRLSIPLKAGLRDWRRDMSSHDLQVFETLAGDVLEDLGYARGSSRATIAARVEATFTSGRASAQRAWDRARRLVLT